MQILPQTSNRYNPDFGRFIKIKGSAQDINRIKLKFDEYSNDLNVISKKQDDENSILYVFTGETYDKLIDLISKVSFFNLRRNPEKYIDVKPEKLKLKKVEKELDNKSFII